MSSRVERPPPPSRDVTIDTSSGERYLNIPERHRCCASSSIMSNKNRLLDMLNSATSPPNAMQPTTTLTPASGTPREPSPLPPPSALQAVSLSDLFAGLTSPSAPQPMRHEDLSVSLNGTQTKASTTATPSIGREATDSPSSDPTTRPDHKANLLNMFKSRQVSL